MFPLRTPNAVAFMKELEVEWSSSAVAKDTAKQKAIFEQYLRVWRAHPDLGYVRDPDETKPICVVCIYNVIGKPDW